MPYRLLGKMVITLPVAVILYILLTMFAGVSFDIKWLALAIALDVADWLVAEMV